MEKSQITYDSGHGDGYDDGVRVERERCVKIARDMGCSCKIGSNTHWPQCPQTIALKIETGE